MTSGASSAWRSTGRKPGPTELTELVDGSLVGDVADERVGGSAGLADRSSDVRGLGVVQPVDRDRIAVAGESQRDRARQAGATGVPERCRRHRLHSRYRSPSSVIPLIQRWPRTSHQIALPARPTRLTRPTRFVFIGNCLARTPRPMIRLYR